jgi:hypothetical protein
MSAHGALRLIAPEGDVRRISHTDGVRTGALRDLSGNSDPKAFQSKRFRRNSIELRVFYAGRVTAQRPRERRTERAGGGRDSPTTGRRLAAGSTSVRLGFPTV